MIYSAIKVLGLSEWAARLPMLVCGIASLLFLFWLTQQLYGKRAASLTLLLAATAPGLVFFSRNLQLESPMVAAGLGALATLRVYRSRSQTVWLVLALILLSLAILAKYTAVLFWPALTYIWFSQATTWRNRKEWIIWIICTILATLPAVVWLIYAYSNLPQDNSVQAANNYFLRFAQWSPSNLFNALLSIWPRLLLQLGPAILFPAAIAGMAGLATSGWPKRASSWLFPTLLALPWYFQLIYPSAWVDNPYYEYCAIYGLCLASALIGLRAFEQIVNLYQLSRQRQIALVAGAAIFVTLANFWSYRDTYHRAYYPWPVINQPEHFYSARQVARLNQAKAPVLTDTSMTLYYSEADLSNSRYYWWASSDETFLDLIKSCQYEFIAVDYPPTISILNTIHQTGYQQIAPAAWQKGPQTTCEAPSTGF
jgi:4-amino-4-deoxy-L-arabinose transferase-like glycosyltransferase